MNYIESLVRKSVFIQNFINDADKGNLSHAYMVIGEDTESIDAAVSVMAQAVFCRNRACGECIVCKRVKNSSHANVRVYDAYSREIVNEIIDNSYMQPLESGKNVFVLKKFDGMQPRLQNALLKTVEEPQSGVLMILTAANESAVLPTIRSRVKAINLNIWNKATIKTELIQRGYAEECAEFASELCAQSLIRALALADDGDAKQSYTDMLDVVMNIENSSMIPRYIKKFGTDRNKFAAKLEMLELIFYNALNDGVNGVDNEVAARFSTAAISNILESIVDAEAKNKVNTNIDNIVTDLLLSILEKRFRTA